MINRLDFIREVKRAADGSWSTQLPSCGVTVSGRELLEDLRIAFINELANHTVPAASVVH